MGKIKKDYRLQIIIALVLNLVILFTFTLDSFSFCLRLPLGLDHDRVEEAKDENLITRERIEKIIKGDLIDFFSLWETNKEYLINRQIDVLTELKLRKGDSFLIIGPGYSVLPVVLAKLGLKVVAVDINPAAIRFLRDRSEEYGAMQNLQVIEDINKVEGKFQYVFYPKVFDAGMFLEAIFFLTVGYIPEDAEDRYREIGNSVDKFLPPSLRLLDRRAVILATVEFNEEVIKFLEKKIVDLIYQLEPDTTAKILPLGINDFEMTLLHSKSISNGIAIGINRESGDMRLSAPLGGHRSIQCGI